MFYYIDVIKRINHDEINLIIAPTSIYLPLFKDSKVNLCVQNIDFNEKLKLTGDISINQLKSLDVKYAIIGHYERRKYYKENEFTLLSKIKNALENDIKVIYCIGESLEEAYRRVEYQVLERQIARIFNKLTEEEQKNIILAYEPSYLIGKDTTYDLLKIRAIILFIKKLVRDYYDLNLPVVFGGNIKPENITDLLNLKIIDGFIICSSILNPENIPQIIQKIAIK